MDRIPSYLIITDVTVADYRPMLAKTWHPTLNGRVTPDRVMIGSDLGVFWKCPRCSAVWAESVRSRVNADGIGHTGCTNPLPESIFTVCTVPLEVPVERPSRSGRQPTFVADLHPELSVLWNKKLNGKLKFTDVKLSHPGRLWFNCPVCNKPRAAMITTMRKGSPHRCLAEDLKKAAKKASRKAAKKD
jgi:hypothetical protein